MTHIQRTINFESSVSTEMEPVAKATSLPPLFVLPERQIVYEGAAAHDDWPDAKSLHDRYTITVDRIVAYADGPAHRFVIKQGDVVRVSLGSVRFRPGIVTGISHVDGKVRVSLCEGSRGSWFNKQHIYPHKQQLLRPLSEWDANVTDVLSSLVCGANRANSDVDQDIETISNRTDLVTINKEEDDHPTTTQSK
jgi:hypothetical protein